MFLKRQMPANALGAKPKSQLFACVCAMLDPWTRHIRMKFARATLGRFGFHADTCNEFAGNPMRESAALALRASCENTIGSMQG